MKDDGSAFGFHRPTLTQAVLAAAISAAHARSKLAVVHIATLADAREALAAGTDGLAHVYAGAPSAEVAREASRRGAFWTPTLSVTTQGCPQQTAARWDGTPRAYPSIEAKSNLRRKQGSSSNVEQCRWMYEAVRQMHAARVRLLAGTDVPNPGTAHGASLHGELALLVEAGLTPAEALAAATAEPAAAFGLSDRGRIAPGYRADLLLVDGDPLQDIRATRRIASVWKAGVEVTRTPPR